MLCGAASRTQCCSSRTATSGALEKAALTRCAPAYLLQTSGTQGRAGGRRMPSSPSSRDAPPRGGLHGLRDRHRGLAAPWTNGRAVVVPIASPAPSNMELCCERVKRDPRSRGCETKLVRKHGKKQCISRRARPAASLTHTRPSFYHRVCLPCRLLTIQESTVFLLKPTQLLPPLPTRTHWMPQAWPSSTEQDRHTASCQPTATPPNISTCCNHCMATPQTYLGRLQAISFATSLRF